MKTKQVINRELERAYDVADIETQYNGCIEAIADIMEAKTELGTSSEFLIELRDFLLAYNK